ncbi:MAG: hypothetical protein SGJ24_00980 [Chloroflexota bacterium]|nr:hypothetical protein [Chloroflexota bacterium]
MSGTGDNPFDGITCSTPTLIPFVTNTPATTPTLSPPTATYQAAIRLATTFPLPMDPSNLSTQPARLSNTEFVDRTGNPPLLCSRDINPIGESNPGYNLIAPANAEVMIIDQTFGSPYIPTPGVVPGYAQLEYDNVNLGRFLALRLRYGTLPGEIQSAITSYLGGTIPDANGWIYIGYAHMNSIESALAAQFESSGTAGLPVVARQVLGTSGNSDTPLPHLDVSVFYVLPFGSPDVGGSRPLNTSYDEGAGIMPRYMQAFYRLFKNRETFGATRVIDPLILWPLLAAPTDTTTGQFANRYATLVAQGC